MPSKTFLAPSNPLSFSLHFRSAPPSLPQFLGINLDMNRVLGKKVIDARGAALEAGVEVGDLLVEVNGMEVRGIDVDIKVRMCKC